MQYFGKPWDAPVCKDTRQALTPIGAPCLDCGRPIEEGDRGYLIPFARTDGPATIEVHHRVCFHRQVVPDTVMEIKGFNTEPARPWYRGSRFAALALILTVLALGEGCVWLAERDNDNSAKEWLIMSAIGAPCFGFIFFALPGLIIGSLIAKARYHR